MKWLKDMLTDARALLLAPLTNILCLGGLVLIGASFVDFDKATGLSLHGQVHAVPVAAGAALVLLGVFIFWRAGGSSEPRKKLDYEKGIQIKRGTLEIVIKRGEIERVENASRNCAIVLPANTTFIDDCAADKRTAMGAFFCERFPEEVGSLPSLFKQVLAAAGLEPTPDGRYSPGTTVILPDRFAKPAQVVVTATTTRLPDAGIVSSPQMICGCVEGVLRTTANNRIDTLYIPILGSGHGGVDRGSALLFLVLAMLHFSRVYHHIKRVFVIVHPGDISTLDQSRELRQIVAL